MQPGDRPIPDALSVRVVRVTAEIAFTAVVDADLLAKAEVLERLRQGVESVGGRLTAAYLEATAAEWHAPGATGGPPAGSDDRE